MLNVIRYCAFLITVIVSLVGSALPAVRTSNHTASPVMSRMIEPFTTTFTPTATSTPSPEQSSVPNVPTASEFITSYVPLVANGFRAQVPMLGASMVRYNAESGLDKALELQLHWASRATAVSWGAVEPQEGQYHWEALADLETELLRVRAISLEPIVAIHSTPQWAQKIVPYACGPIRSDKFESFAKLIEQLVTRYGTSSPYRVRYWQLGNEPDISPGEVGPDSGFGCWGDPNDSYFGGGHYAEMLKVVYPRVKAIDPEARVLMGGLLLECDPYSMSVGDGCINELRWKSGFFLEGVMQAGGGAYFDIADVHSYAVMRPDLPAKMHSQYAFGGNLGGTGIPEKVGFVRAVMGKYGYGNKPLVLGEMALLCENPTSECYDVAAAFVPRAYAEAYGLDVLGGMYYAMIWEPMHAGLVFPDLAPRPAFWAHKFMGSQLVNSHYEGPVAGYPGVSGHLFDQGDILVQIVWSTDGTEQAISVPANFARAFDKFGNIVAPSSGQLTIGWSPLYIELQNVAK